ncbi:MAG: hypothetical protein QOD42_407 [Sphingomonadales bacterium]|jgi:hypothetical protein|nr:hypothetical protein [Sphingomonadales bacterium]
MRKIEDVPTSEVNGISIHRRKDQASRRNRAVKWAEATFPGPLCWLKGLPSAGSPRGIARAGLRRNDGHPPELTFVYAPDARITTCRAWRAASAK